MPSNRLYLIFDTQLQFNETLLILIKRCLRYFCELKITTKFNVYDM